MLDDAYRTRLLDETFVQSVEWHEELASTNDRALQLAAESAAELPALIGARRQTHGRGRGANAWWSAEGALTFSLLIDESTAGCTLTGGRVALPAGLAVATALCERLPAETVGLKWPNDVHVRGRKICGILTEVPSGRRDAAVIGVGINVNNRRRDAPPEVAGALTSVCDELGTTASRFDLLRSVLSAIETQLHLAPPALSRAWGRFCVLTNHPVSVVRNGEELNGVCRGVADDGALLVETPAGLTAVHSATQVRRWDMPSGT